MKGVRISVSIGCIENPDISLECIIGFCSIVGKHTLSALGEFCTTVGTRPDDRFESLPVVHQCEVHCCTQPDEENKAGEEFWHRCRKSVLINTKGWLLHPASRKREVT